MRIWNGHAKNQAILCRGRTDTQINAASGSQTNWSEREKDGPTVVILRVARRHEGPHIQRPRLMLEDRTPTLFHNAHMQPEMAEITSLLLPGQTAIDQPDLTGRVFELKIKALLKRLSGGMIFRILVSEEDTFRAHPNDKPTSLTPNIVFRSILERMDGARHQHQSTPVPMTTIPMDV